jgi:signal transduction histidine kinase
MKFVKYLILLILFLGHSFGFSQEAFIYKGERALIGKHLEILVDSTSTLTIDQVIKSNKFQPSSSEVPNLGITNHAYWVRFTVENPKAANLNVQVEYAMIDSISFYQMMGDSILNVNHTGGHYPFHTRQLNEHQTYVYTFEGDQQGSHTFYIRVKSGAQLMLPIYVSARNQLLDGLLRMDLLFGMYLGVILVMVLYNVFVYFSLRDKHYLLYILYLLSVGYTQASLEGYAFRFLFSDHPYFATWNIYFASALIGITAIEFAKAFLGTKRYFPTLTKVSYLFYMVYGVAILLPFIGYSNLGYQLILMSAALSGIYVFSLALGSLLRGSRSARFFLLAWSVFILAVIIYVLKDVGILPYNTFTHLALQIGSAIEAVLLSIALADKINILRDEKDAFQYQAYEAVKENERIVRLQNQMLEQEVQARTKELSSANATLEKTLKDLQDTQVQLIDSEKMASLGQLTAGIAHEINNPINFVTSNVTPLKRDIAMMQELMNEIEALHETDLSLEEKRQKIQELKEELDYEYLVSEIDYLLMGISEGASRTSDIVKGLRLFSRLDEDDVKFANLEEGLDSTVAIINHLLNDRIVIEKQYAQLPAIECFPGKLNQVFLNIMTNAIHAIQDRWKEKSGGLLIIRTREMQDSVEISIKDNGIGMTEETKRKLFEPFFTTKEVGVGTGLGLSIAWKTVMKHNGSIDVQSFIGEGTEFIITLPKLYQSTTND